MEEHKIDFVAHDDIPYFDNSNGEGDGYGWLKKKGYLDDLETLVCLRQARCCWLERLISTSDAGSQYRCGRVGRGIQPPSIPHTPLTYTKTI